jgi:hypothetical protein
MEQNITHIKGAIMVTILVFFHSLCQSQALESVNVSQFGFRPDGKTDNTEAFQKLVSYVNKKGGNVILNFPKGIYYAGKQTKTLKRQGYYLSASDVLGFVDVSNVVIKGAAGTVFKYNDNLYFGSFEVPSLKKMDVSRDFYKPENACYIGNFISFTNSRNITIENLTLDGNADRAIGGGAYGDIGIQIPYTGLNIINTQNVIVRNLVSENFGLDGVIVSNRLGIATANDSVYFYDCRFSKNGRQGMSWISGNQLEARNCRFELTGRGKFSSSPGAGLDIESEEHPIRNGKFVSCTFFDNVGCAMVSETGDVADCFFDSCSFIGTTMYSVWPRQPGFVFKNCSIWGSGVHGYSSEDDLKATKFIKCKFTDAPYLGKYATYGNFLFESTGVKRLSFEECIFEAGTKKIMWLDGSMFSSPQENYQVKNCTITVQSALPVNDFYVLFRQVTIQNSRFQLGNKIKGNKNIALGVDVESKSNTLINNSISEL